MCQSLTRALDSDSGPKTALIRVDTIGPLLSRASAARALPEHARAMPRAALQLPSPLRQQQRVARSDRVLEQLYDLDGSASFLEERGAIEDHCKLDEARQQVPRQ